MKLQDCNPQPHIDFRASVHDTDGFAFSPRPCGPCWWSQRPAGWTWTCWESHCAWSCQWPGYICRWKQVEQRWKGSQIITWAWATAPTCCARQEVQEDGLTWWFLPWCVCTDLQTDFWRCCFVAAKQRDIYCYFTTRGPPGHDPVMHLEPPKELQCSTNKCFNIFVVFYDLQFSPCFTFSSISKATAQWWFSSGEMSLYRSASSVRALICTDEHQSLINIHFIFHSVIYKVLFVWFLVKLLKQEGEWGPLY